MLYTSFDKNKKLKNLTNGESTPTNHVLFDTNPHSTISAIQFGKIDRSLTFSVYQLKKDIKVKVDPNGKLKVFSEIQEVKFLKDLPADLQSEMKIENEIIFVFQPNFQIIVQAEGEKLNFLIVHFKSVCHQMIEEKVSVFNFYSFFLQDYQNRTHDLKA